MAYSKDLTNDEILRQAAELYSATDAKLKALLADDEMTTPKYKWLDEVNEVAKKLGEQQAKEFFSQYLGTPLASKPGFGFSKGRNVGKTPLQRKVERIEADIRRQQTQALREEFDRACVGSTMPTAYPTLTRRGAVVEMELPAMAPLASIELCQALVAVTPLKRIDDFHAEFPSGYYDTVRSILMEEFGAVIDYAEQPEVDPSVTPIELFIEYVGACRSRGGNQQGQQSATCSSCGGTGILPPPAKFRINKSLACPKCRGFGRIVAQSPAYASAWVDGGWNCILSEQVLKAYFGEPAQAFDGDFYKHLLGSKDLSKTYRQLARRYHPDLGGNVEQFHKLKEAYDVLRDPKTRKRYEAGLKFQEKALQSKVNEVVFRVPKSCGRVLVKGVWEEVRSFHPPTISRGNNPERRLHVTEILEWRDIYNDRGEIMVATWDRNHPDPFRKGFDSGNQKPFTVSYESTEEFVIDVKV